MPNVATEQAASEASFDHVLDFLTEYERNLRYAAHQALWEIAPYVEQEAKANHSYENDTEATERSTVAYVWTEGEERDEPREAVLVANERRPGSADEDSIPTTQMGEQDALGLDVMSATNYSYQLNVRNGLESMYLSDALLGQLWRLEHALRDAIDDVMTREG